MSEMRLEEGIQVVNGFDSRRSVTSGPLSLSLSPSSVTGRGDGKALDSLASRLVFIAIRFVEWAATYPEIIFGNRYINVDTHLHW